MAFENFDSTFLLQQLQLGSQQAFAKIYDLYSRLLYRNILRLVQDDDVAQELLQDLFLKLWVKRNDLDIDKPLKPYLYKMAGSLAFNHFRRISQDQRLINQLIITTVDYVTNIEDAIIDRETHALLHKAIEHLPPQRKQVFTLCKLEGKSYNEVSLSLGISNGTIKEHIVKANKAIKQFFLENHHTAILLIIYSFLL